MATTCRYEFSPDHFGFADASPDQFYRLQWTKNRWIFLTYRLLVFGYQLAWFVVDLTTDLSETAPGEKPQHLALSNWAEVLMLVYFLISSVIAIVGLVGRNQISRSDGDCNSLSWYHKINWVFFNVSVGAAFIVTIFYWVVIGRTRTFADNTRPRTVHIHVINSILALLDIQMVAFPTRLLHFVYTTGFGAMYGVFVLIMHWTAVDSRIYSVLDWKKAPGVAAGWLFGAVAIMPAVAQSIAFGFYHLRACIARATVLKKVERSGQMAETTGMEPAGEHGRDNPAFEASNH